MRKCRCVWTSPPRRRPRCQNPPEEPSRGKSRITKEVKHPRTRHTHLWVLREQPRPRPPRRLLLHPRRRRLPRPIHLRGPRTLPPPRPPLLRLGRLILRPRLRHLFNPHQPQPRGAEGRRTRGARAHLSVLGRRGHRGGRRSRALAPAAAGVPSAASSSAASTTARVRRGGGAPASLHHDGQAAAVAGVRYAFRKRKWKEFFFPIFSYEENGGVGGGFIGREVGPLVRNLFWSVPQRGNVPVFSCEENRKRSQQSIIDMGAPPVSAIGRCFSC